MLIAQVLNTINPTLEKLTDNYESGSLVTSVTHDYNMGTGPHVIATFEFEDGIEVVDFPEFHQGNLIARANPSFELVGVPGATPLLYNAVDNTLQMGASTGVSGFEELFDVNIVLKLRN